MDEKDRQNHKEVSLTDSIKQIDNLQKQLEKCYEPIRQYQNAISHSLPDLSGLTAIRDLTRELTDIHLKYMQIELSGIQECMTRIANITNLLTIKELEKIDFNTSNTYSKLLDISSKIYAESMYKINHSVDADYLLDSFKEIYNNSNDYIDFNSSEVFKYIKENKEEINKIIDFKNENDFNSSVQTNPSKKEIDWKFVIGSIIVPLLIAIIGIYSAKKEPTIEINNYYGNSNKTELKNNQDLSNEDIEKMIEILKEMENQNK